MSTITSEKATTGGQEPHPRIRVENEDGHLGFHAVSDSNQWMSVCPTTGFTRAKSVLDNCANDSCAPDYMCPQVKNRPSEGSKKRTNLHCSKREEHCQ